MPRPKVPYFPESGPLDPFAGPDWIWRRAELLVSIGRNASVKRDGPDIVRVIRYLRARDHGFSGRWAKHRERDPDIHEAIDISEASALFLLELKCRVLAGESIGRIAVEMQVSRSGLLTYLKTFYDVSHRLDQRWYILHRVIGIGPEQPSTAHQLALHSAYNHGPEAVAPWVEWLRDVNKGNDLTTAEGRRRETIELMVLSDGLEIVSDKAIRFAKWLHAGGVIEPKLFHSRSPKEVVSQNVAGLLRNLTFNAPDIVRTSGANRYGCEDLPPGETRRPEREPTASAST